MSWERMPEEESLEETLENRHRRCRRDRLDRLSQVRAAATGKALSPTVDSRVRWTFSVSEEEERRCLRVPKSAVYSSSSARYDGAVPCRHLYMRTASLNSIRSGALSQCSWWRSGVMRSYLDEENTSRAAEFMANWSCWRR